jgi:proline iminopeptidase
MDATKELRDFFPRLEPFERGMLALPPGPGPGARHHMYWEQSGNPEGTPVLFLHGGPGAGSSPAHRRFFDPGFWRIVIFDQRGAGRATPYASVEDNTTRHLIDDIERLRQHLRIERWIVFGGSWGSLLALAYGIRHPERVLGFVLRGIFLGRVAEIDWFLYGIRTVFPEAWRTFAEFIPEGERGDLLGAYHRRLINPDPAVHLPAAQVWSRYESTCSYLVGPADESASATGSSLALARLEAHYFKNHLFLENDEILRHLNAVRAIPAILVQGRYDMVCPIVTADALARAWPEAEYAVVPDAGHSALEPGIRSALIKAMEAMKGRAVAAGPAARRRRA